MRELHSNGAIRRYHNKNKVKVVRAERKVDMNFSQLGKIQELKGHMDTFHRNHPKFPMFLGAVAQNAVEEGTIIEINVTDRKSTRLNSSHQPQSRMPSSA